jgi:DNA-binding transcriptional MerR regulator/plastocyanin
MLTIGAVASQARLRPSALRYYEQEGLVPPAQRRSGRRVYDPAVLDRLAVIEVAKRAGFTLHEIRVLLQGFGRRGPASARWRKLAAVKHAELEAQIAQAERMQQLLAMLTRCECPTLADCGRALQGARTSVPRQPTRGRVVRSIAATLLVLAALCGSGDVGAAELRGRVIAGDGTGVAGAVVFLRTPATPPAPATPPRSAVMDQIDKQFVPRLLPVAVGTEVRFPNHDQIHHHVYSFSRVKSFDLPLSKGEEAAPILFDAPGVVKVGCNIHDWMMGVILVVPTPVFAVTDDGGAFQLRDVPTGEVTIAAWHEASDSSLDDATHRVTVTDAPPSDLIFTLAVKPERARPATHGGRMP